MYCSNCGAEVSQKDARFCTKCGHELPMGQQSESDPNNGSDKENMAPGSTKWNEVQTNYEESSGHPARRAVRRGGRKGLVVGVVAAAVIVIGGAGFTVMAKPFASGKQLLLSGVSSAGLGSGAQGSTQEHLTLSLQNIKAPAISGAAAGLLSSFNGSTIDLNILFNPKDKRTEIDFDSQYQSVKHSGSLWIDNDHAVLNASDYQSLLAPVLPQGASLPKYLTTDSSQAQALQKFWNNLDAGSTQLTQSQQQAVVSMEKMIVSAIPDKYIKRSALNSITISFNQQGLEDILKSEVQAVYAHKTEMAAGISALSQASATLPQGNVEQTVIQALNHFPEEAAMAGISTAFNSGTVAVGNTTLRVTKKVLGKGLSDSFDGSVAVHSPNLSMTMGYKVTSHTPATGTVQMPSPTASDSQTFSQWTMAAQGY